MKLKELELKGFKSFPTRTTITFTEGITAIVGPNGSGKSNIIEAIRWVMGENSAKSLRGDRMSDIIFSGTDTLDPVNLAEVTLSINNQDHFLNSDLDNIQITRQMNRTGASDYYINKKRCRLRDITDLFVDTGLGKESFSIISQGQVEEILNSKPQERRSIIEEVAGVLKYKEQKSETNVKLEDTMNNLDRVRDILFEINNQLEKLEEESKKAKKYLSLKEKFVEIDLSVTVEEIDDLYQKVKDIEVQLSELTIKKQLLEREIVRVEKQRQQTIGIRQKTDEELDFLQKEHLDLIQKIERQEGTIQLVETRNQHEAEQKNTITETFNKLKDEIKEVKRKRTQVTQNLSDKKDEYQILKKKEKELKESIQSFSTNREELMEDLRAEYFDALQSKTAYNNEKNYLERQRSQLEARYKRIQKEEETLQEDYRKQEEQEKAIREKRNQKEKKVEDLLQTYASLDAQIQEKNRLIEQLTQVLQQKRQESEKLKNRIESLENMQENYTGYYSGVQQVMKSAADLSGIKGTVAELIEVPEYLTEALDTSLASSSQFIIVEKDQDGREAIEFLKRKKAGRATFLPLETIKPRSVQENVKQTIESAEAFVGIASDLISYPSEIEDVIQNLLGNIIIASDLKGANRLSKQVRQRYRVVTLEGDVVNVGGSMSGGSRKRNSKQTLFQQSTRIKQLKESYERTARDLTEVEEEYHKAKELLSQLNEKLTEIKSKGDQSRIEENTLKSQLDNARNYIKDTKQNLQALQFEINEIRSSRKEILEDLNRMDDNQARTEAKVTEIKEQMDRAEETWKNHEKEKESLEEKREKLTEKTQEIGEELAGLKKEKSLLDEQYKSVKLEQEEEHQKLEKLKESYSKELSLEELQAELASDKDAKEKLLAQQKELQMKRKKILKKEEKYNKDLNKSRDDREKVKTETQQLEISAGRYDEKLNYLLNYLTENYHMSVKEARTKSKTRSKEEQDRTQLENLRQDIDNLGSVNLQAIEEFERLEERYHFMVQQRDDLHDARHDLNQTMDELDGEVEERFKTTFDAVEKEFKEVFPEIFGGGKAELVLTEPDNLLETGIEIKAQPPGKNLQSLNLLSGGERALTAISLLFAIIQTNPIPFVILDEVEAALDEANVLRFSRYLNQFEEDEIQFIVITHRKGTMEQADSLYGVVMQERGVSSLVSVHLKEIDHILN